MTIATTRFRCAILLVGVCLCTIGCSSDMPTPRTRFGSIPYPGIINLFKLPDPQQLGHHYYRKPLGSGLEADHGIVYTTDAGFLDLGHLRECIDWTRYCAYHIEKALLTKQTTITLPSNIPSRYEITFHYPDSWDQLDPEQRQQLIRELSIVIGQRLSFLMGNWHELATWYGYKSYVIVPEDRSAFTYDDVMSHMIGVQVAGEALRSGDPDFDRAVTVALRQRLDALGVLPTAADTMHAIRRVEGLWWEGGESLKRYLDMGLDDGTIEPWLVPGMGGPDPAPSYSLPPMSDVLGHDLTGFYHVLIQPRLFEWLWMKSVFEHPPQKVDPDVHLPVFMADIHREMAEDMGPNVTDPRVASR